MSEHEEHCPPKPLHVRFQGSDCSQPVEWNQTVLNLLSRSAACPSSWHQATVGRMRCGAAVFPLMSWHNRPPTPVTDRRLGLMARWPVKRCIHAFAASSENAAQYMQVVGLKYNASAYSHQFSDTGEVWPRNPRKLFPFARIVGKREKRAVPAKVPASERLLPEASEEEGVCRLYLFAAARILYGSRGK